MATSSTQSSTAMRSNASDDPSVIAREDQFREQLSSLPVATNAISASAESLAKPAKPLNRHVTFVETVSIVEAASHSHGRRPGESKTRWSKE